MATYKTHQKQELLDFLEKYSDRAFTIEEMMATMEADPEFSQHPPGKSTIYRLLPAMVEDHRVGKFVRGRKTTYQIVGRHGCHHHMHMKCTDCGRLFHMTDEESALFMKQVSQHCNFAINLAQTLLYGTCSSCTKKGGTHE